MEHGTKIADMCYEYFDEAGTKGHRKIGSLFYFRNHKGGTPSAQLRIDVIPSAAWASNPDTWFIGNFLASEKVPDAPYVCGKIYVPSDTRGDHTYLGHIGTRETSCGERTQYYMQWFGIPLREINRAMKKSYEAAMRFVLAKHDYNVHGNYEIFNEVMEELDRKKHSLYLSIELDG